jgi:hypothetical protein
MNESKEKRKDVERKSGRNALLVAGGKLVEKRLRMEETNAQGTRDVMSEIMSNMAMATRP